MDKNIDIDTLSDEEFMDFLESPEVLEDDSSNDDSNSGDENDDSLEADDENQEEEQEEQEQEDDSEEEQKEDNYDEDTDHSDELDDSDSDETETNDDSDGDDLDTEEPDDEEQEEEDEENSQNGNNSDDDKKSSDEPETKQSGDGDDVDTGEINYKDEYKKFKNFYDEVTSEFVANGKTVRGFSDPKKIKQAQQMAAGFSDKMAGFKKYRPYMNPLKERGMLDSPEKFDLAMSLIDGDPEALKQHLKNLNIDPIDLDMEEIKYDNRTHLASKAEIVLDDILESADSTGVKDRVQDVLGRQWDRESVIELIEDPQSGSDLIEHLNNGIFDLVQDKIAEKKIVDVNGVFSSKNAISQYREAAGELEAEIRLDIERRNREQTLRSKNKVQKTSNGNDAKAEAYKAKVEKRNKEAALARKKAASVSKKRPVKKKKVQSSFDPAELSDEEFMKFFEAEVYN